MRNGSLKVYIIAITALLIVCGSLGAGWGSSATEVRLGIPPRLQWNNSEGFCGETDIQMAALYYGTYISQYQVRKLSGGELLVSENDAPVYKALGLKTDVWNAGSPKPQWRSYLSWVKKNLIQGHPVMMTVFVRGMNFPTYDHIVPVVGFGGQAADGYDPNDRITFYDNFRKTLYTRTFGSLPDTRAMNGNGATEKYCVPQEVDYGCAVTGIVDANRETVPVRLWLDSWSEPNVSLKEKPKTFNTAVAVSDLVVGKKYLLLRYNDYHKLPESCFANSHSDKTVVFTATAKNMTFYDGIRSDSIAIYRCVLKK